MQRRRFQIKPISTRRWAPPPTLTQFTSASATPFLARISRSTKAKPQQISKYYYGPVTSVPTAKAVNPDRQWSELPMPNAASVRDLAFLKAGFATQRDERERRDQVARRHPGGVCRKRS